MKKVNEVSSARLEDAAADYKEMSEHEVELHALVQRVKEAFPDYTQNIEFDVRTEWEDLPSAAKAAEAGHDFSEEPILLEAHKKKLLADMREAIQAFLKTRVPLTTEAADCANSVGFDWLTFLADGSVTSHNIVQLFLTAPGKVKSISHVEKLLVRIADMPIVEIEEELLPQFAQAFAKGERRKLLMKVMSNNELNGKKDAFVRSLFGMPSGAFAVLVIAGSGNKIDQGELVSIAVEYAMFCPQGIDWKKMVKFVLDAKSTEEAKVVEDQLLSGLISPKRFFKTAVGGKMTGIIRIPEFMRLGLGRLATSSVAHPAGDSRPIARLIESALSCTIPVEFDRVRRYIIDEKTPERTDDAQMDSLKIATSIMWVRSPKKEQFWYHFPSHLMPLVYGEHLVGNRREFVFRIYNAALTTYISKGWLYTKYLKCVVNAGLVNLLWIVNQALFPPNVSKDKDVSIKIKGNKNAIWLSALPECFRQFQTSIGAPVKTDLPAFFAFAKEKFADTEFQPGICHLLWTMQLVRLHTVEIYGLVHKFSDKPIKHLKGSLSLLFCVINSDLACVLNTSLTPLGVYHAYKDIIAVALQKNGLQRYLETLCPLPGEGNGIAIIDSDYPEVSEDERRTNFMQFRAKSATNTGIDPEIVLQLSKLTGGQNWSDKPTLLATMDGKIRGIEVFDGVPVLEMPSELYEAAQQVKPKKRR